MDNIIIFALESVDILNYIDYKMSKEIKKRYYILLNKMIEMADVLKFAIKNLRDKPGAIFKDTTTIREIENKIDLIFREFLN
jgi:hypothetical protein